MAHHEDGNLPFGGRCPPYTLHRVMVREWNARGSSRAHGDHGGNAPQVPMGERSQVQKVSRQPSPILFWVRLCAFFLLAVLSAPIPSAGEVDLIQSVTLVGTFQVDLGCAHDWDPSCTQSYLEDADGDGVYEFSTRQLPRGTYECRVVINEDWTESYGEEGDRDGANIIFQASEEGSLITFRYDPLSHVLSVNEDMTAVVAASVACQSNQECTDKLGSDWECKSGLCVQISGENNNTTFFCAFSSFLGNNHPALDTLRRFRDEVLRKYTFGRRLIDVYYRNQHKVFSFVERHPTLRKCAVRLIESFASVLEFFLDDSRAGSRPRD